jgi:type I restriction-modification system DNA methylase subunit
MKEKSIKQIRKEFKDNGIFYTPPELALKLKSYIDFEPNSVYDPTCGAGNLLRVFHENVKKYGQELYSEQLELIDLPNFTGYAGDTLTDDKFQKMKFECIVANPPFSIKWNPDGIKGDIRFKDCPDLPPPSKADWAFMLHILYHLSDNGIAVILEFPGILYRGQREGKVRKWFVEQNVIDRVVNIPGNTFTDTSIATCIIVLKKKRKTTDIIFEDGEKEEVVSIDQIIENDYCLSPSLYIPDEIEKEEIDPAVLEEESRKLFLIRVRKELQFDKMVCEMEGTSIHSFIVSIRAVLNEFDDKRKKKQCDNQLSLF